MISRTLFPHALALLSALALLCPHPAAIAAEGKVGETRSRSGRSKEEKAEDTGKQKNRDRDRDRDRDKDKDKDKDKGKTGKSEAKPAGPEKKPAAPAKPDAQPPAKPGTQPPAKPGTQPPATVEEAPIGRNILANGGFERFFLKDNVWDGVIDGDYLSGNRYTARGLTEGSRLGRIDMPVQVNLVDLNSDGKLDIVMADPTGFFYVYFNESETPAEPKYSTAEILPIFVSTSRYWQEHTQHKGLYSSRRWHALRVQDRMCPRIAMVDWDRSGSLDLFIGNFAGELFYLPNGGNSRTPNYRQPVPIETAIVPTKPAGLLWLNLAAPAVGEFVKKGQNDVLLGEGTYSANSVHLLYSSSTSNQPKFEIPQYLCYGMGREHLVPTVVDYNADGFPDVITGDRNGELALFLHPGKSWKPGRDLPFSTVLTLGNQTKLGGLITPCAADFNGDGLFDLLLGRTNGRISLSLNTGTKENPKFAAPTDLKGKDKWGKNLRLPSSWNASPAMDRGNSFGVYTVVDATTDPEALPTEGKYALRASYMPVANRVIPFPPNGIPGGTDLFEAKNRLNFDVPATYELTFKVKGSNVRSARVVLERDGIWHIPKAARATKGERQTVEHIYEYYLWNDDHPVGAQWTTVKKRIDVKFKNPILNAELKQIDLELRLEANLSFGKGKIYYDDVRLARLK